MRQRKAIPVEVLERARAAAAKPRPPPRPEPTKQRGEPARPRQPRTRIVAHLQRLHPMD